MKPGSPADLIRLGTTTFVGEPPPAQVHVVVSVASLLGLDDAPGEIPQAGDRSTPPRPDRQPSPPAPSGGGWSPTPSPQTALELSTGRYRPTQVMADLIAALDGTCRAPGCTIAAATCDIDHADRFGNAASDPPPF